MPPATLAGGLARLGAAIPPRGSIGCGHPLDRAPRPQPVGTRLWAVTTGLMGLPVTSPVGSRPLPPVGGYPRLGGRKWFPVLLWP